MTRDKDGFHRVVLTSLADDLDEHDARGRAGLLRPVPAAPETPVPPRVEAIVATKVCKVCGEAKPLERFQVSNLPKVGGARLGTCNSCRGLKSQSPEQTLSALPRLRAVRDKAAIATRAAQQRLDAAQQRLDAAQQRLKTLHDQLGKALQ